MDIERLYEQTLVHMERMVHGLERRVPPPQVVDIGGHEVYRYTEKTVHQALVLRLVRIVSGLHAARVLLRTGFVQELGALQRMIDEFQEDVHFLTYAAVDGETDLHSRFLDAFFQEEYTDARNPVASLQDRQMIPRKKIRAYLSKREGVPMDASRAVATAKTVSKAYSGYIHGAAVHIMDMYGGQARGFHLRGMLGTPRIDEHSYDLWNYFFRGICAFAMAAKAFGEGELYESIDAFLLHFQEESAEWKAQEPE